VRDGHRCQGSGPELIEALKDGDNKVRVSAVEALGFIGAKSTNVVEALVEARKDENSRAMRGGPVSRTAVGHPKIAVPALIEMLTVKKGVTGQAPCSLRGGRGPGHLFCP